MLSPKGWVAILVLIALVGLYGAHRAIVNTESSRAVATAVQRAHVEAKKTEDELRINLNDLKKDKDAKLARLNNDLSAANDRLRQRPKRTDPPATSGSSCTGRQLYQEDGLFLRGEASRAEALIVERDYYYNLYEDTRKKLDGKR